MADMKWARGETVRLEKGGLRLFREDRGEYAAPETCRWAAADNSGSTPDQTDDGPLWLDFSRPLRVEIGEYGIVSIPVSKDGDSHPYHTGGGVDALVVLRRMFPAWRIEMGLKAAKLVSTIIAPTWTGDDDAAKRCVVYEEKRTDR